MSTTARAGKRMDRLIDDMVETMREYDGVGLAGPLSREKNAGNSSVPKPTTGTLIVSRYSSVAGCSPDPVTASSAAQPPAGDQAEDQDVARKHQQLDDDVGSHLRRRILAISGLLWLPLLLASAVAGKLSDGVDIPFLLDVSARRGFGVSFTRAWRTNSGGGSKRSGKFAMKSAMRISQRARP